MSEERQESTQANEQQDSSLAEETFADLEAPEDVSEDVKGGAAPRANNEDK
jgi:hypothetical protein